MARGYPDFFGYTMFPYGGTPTNEEDLGFTVPNLGTRTVVNISDKGRTHGGELYFYGTGDIFEQVIVTVYHDDATNTVLDIKALLSYGFAENESSFLRLLSYSFDGTNYYASFRYKGDVPFGKTMAVSILNNSGADIDGTSLLRWAKTT